MTRKATDSNLDIEPSLRSIGQHQRNSPVVDPMQPCQPHRVQAGHIGNRCGAIRFYTFRLR